MRNILSVGFGAVVVCFGLLACGDITEPTTSVGPSFGLAKGTAKVTICHKGTTITVGRPSLRAHLAHGDTEGPCDACVAPDLASWWPGNGDADDVVGGNHGTLENGATFAPGKIGQAFIFDGINDQLTAPTAGLPTGSAARTLMFWTRSPNMAVGDKMLAGWGLPGNGNMSAIVMGRFNMPNRKPFFWGWNADVEAISTLNDNTWYHLAVTVEVGGLVKFYIDGIEDASDVKVLNTPSGTTFYMANFFTTVRAFGGLIDEVQVYTRALSDVEIASIVNAGNAGACAP